MFLEFLNSKISVLFINLDTSFVIGVNWENRHDSASGTLKNIVKETEELVTSTRTIIVPPYTKLEACSILFNAKQQSMPYTGQAAFSITGRDSDFVKNIILGEGYTESDILYNNGSHVFVSISGAFTSRSNIHYVYSHMISHYVKDILNFSRVSNENQALCSRSRRPRRMSVHSESSW